MNHQKISQHKIRHCWANGGAKEPCTDLLNLEDIKPDLTDEDDNPFNVDLTFIKKIKVI